jgi:hypothetical protein
LRQKGYYKDKAGSNRSFRITGWCLRLFENPSENESPVLEHQHQQQRHLEKSSISQQDDILQNAQ